MSIQRKRAQTKMDGKTKTLTARVRSAIGMPIANLKELLRFGDEARRHNQSRCLTITSRLVFLFLMFVFIGATQSASAQLNIPVVRGDVGL